MCFSECDLACCYVVARVVVYGSESKELYDFLNSIYIYMTRVTAMQSFPPIYPPSLTSQNVAQNLNEQTKVVSFHL